MGALREKMIEEIRLRNFSPRTEHSYVSAMVGWQSITVSHRINSVRNRSGLICCISKNGVYRQARATWRSRG